MWPGANWPSRGHRRRRGYCWFVTAIRRDPDGDPTPLGGRPVLAAYTRTIAAGSARFGIDEVISTPDGQLSISGSGVADLKGQLGQFVFSVPGEGTVAMRFIGPDMYMQVPSAARAKLSNGKPWLELNVGDVVQAKFGASVSQLQSSSKMSTQYLAYLASVAPGGVVQVGPASIRGIATTEYEATIDLDRAAAHAKGGRAAVNALKRMEAVLGTSTLPIQVSLDGQGRVRQLSVEMQLPSGLGGSGPSATSSDVAMGSLQETIDYFGFGPPYTLQRLRPQMSTA